MFLLLKILFADQRKSGKRFYMRKLVYDAPTRVFHTLFSAFFVCAIIIAKTIDHDSELFPVHMMIGMTISVLVVMRIIWGLVGTRHARFSGFALNPKDLVAYFKGIWAGDKRRWSGHNPASSWSALIMMSLALGLSTTGYLMVSVDVEAYEDIHEIFANTFLVVAILHVAGVALHTFRHKDWIARSMLEGKKEGVPDVDTISDEKNPFAFLMIGIVAAFAILLINGYDRQTQSLALFGTTLQLGEGEGHSHDHGHEDGHDHDHDQEYEEGDEELDLLFDEDDPL